MCCSTWSKHTKIMPTGNISSSDLWYFNLFTDTLLITFIALFSALRRSLRSHVILHKWLAFYSTFLNILWSGVLRVLLRLSVLRDWCQVKLLPSQCILCTPYNHAPCHVTSCKSTYVGCTCLVVTWDLHFWQNDWDLLHTTAVTRG